MRRKPRVPVHVAKSIERIRDTALTRRPVDPANPQGERRPGLDLLLGRAEQIVATVATVASRPDGFSSTTPGNGAPGGGKGGASTMAVPRPAGEPGRLPQTDPARLSDPAERARLDAIARRASSGAPADQVPASSTERAALDVHRARLAPVDRIGADIVRELGRIDASLARVDRLVAEWDRLRDVTDADDSPQCYVASVMHRMPWDLDWTPVVRTTFAGVLEHPWDEERPVCRWVYDFTRRHRRVPSSDELREYLARGSVRVRTGADTGAKP